MLDSTAVSRRMRRHCSSMLCATSKLGITWSGSRQILYPPAVVPRNSARALQAAEATQGKNFFPPFLHKKALGYLAWESSLFSTKKRRERFLFSVSPAAQATRSKPPRSMPPRCSLWGSWDGICRAVFVVYAGWGAS